MKIINMLIKVCNNVFVFLLLMFLMVTYIIVKLLDFLQLNVLNKKFQSQLDLLITYLSNQLELLDILG